MARSVTFIHAADLHLGAPFRGLRAVSPVWADRLVKSIPDAYRKLIDETIREQVDFLIIAGDAFDASHPSYADFASSVTDSNALTMRTSRSISAQVTTILMRAGRASMVIFPKTFISSILMRRTTLSTKKRANRSLC